MNNPLMGGMPNAAMLSQLKSNPIAMLQKAGFNVPSDISSPQAIIQHLMNTGQVSQQQLSQAQQMAQMFK